MIDPVLVDLHDITVRSALWWLLLPAIGLPVSITMYLRGQPGFLSRLIVWFGVVPVFLGAAHLGRWTFGALLAASAVWALWEAARLEEKAVRPTPLVLLGAVLAGGAPLVVAATAPVPWPPIIAGWLLAPAVYFLLPRAAGAVRILMAALYLGLGLAIWVQLLLLPAGYRFVLVAFSVVSVSDILALVAGRAFPRIVLFKRLSPGKTLAGYLGGGAAAVSVAFILWFALPELSGGQVLLTALLLGLGGMLGDLLASAIKRRHRVKDFGRALGRMGGVFDRLDSLLGAGGVFWLTMIFLSGDTMAIPEPTDALGHVTVIQTSRSGDRLTEVVTAELDELTATDAEVLELRPTERYQTLVGFGGSFTESTAHVLSRLSAARRDSVIDAYFAADGAAYSLTRTHINSCDFSLDHYAYVDDGDTSLASFSVNHDLTALIPLIQDAARAPGADFKIIASPWTAPPWMKDNDSWYGGSLRPDLADLWARYLVKYLDAYAEHGIEIWGLTPENEPLGNDGHWDSMHFTPQTMRDFIRDHLGPQLTERGSDTKLLIFDQNRDHVEHWAEVILGDPETARYVCGDGGALVCQHHRLVSRGPAACARRLPRQASAAQRGLRRFPGAGLARR